MAAFDFYTPFFLIAGGVAGILYTQILGAFIKRRPESYLNAQIREVYERFESRMRLSWVLVVVGSLWALQVVIENASAVRSIASN